MGDDFDDGGWPLRDQCSCAAFLRARETQCAPPTLCTIGMFVQQERPCAEFSLVAIVLYHEGSHPAGTDRPYFVDFLVVVNPWLRRVV